MLNCFPGRSGTFSDPPKLRILHSHQGQNRLLQPARPSSQTGLAHLHIFINLIWFLDDGVAGASISDGTLTITDEVESGTEFWLWVYSDDPQTANYGFEVTVVGDALEETA